MKNFNNMFNNMIKDSIKQLELVKAISNLIWKIRPFGSFEGSKGFWENRYKEKGTSGPGSYGRLEHFKREVLNKFLTDHEIKSVIDFGCGDGNQIRNIKFPEYLGIDVSDEAIKQCREHYKDRNELIFINAESYNGEKADLVISLDVIFHLVEDGIFHEYMERIFNASNKFVAIYSSNFEEISLNPFKPKKHVRHRKFTDWIDNNRKAWRLYERIKNPYLRQTGDSAEKHSHSNFYIYKISSIK